MSTFSGEPVHRPTMRRKSSAQNLLSSFKSNPSSSSTVPPPLNLAAASVTTLSFSSAATPTATTPNVREWDAQSLHSDTVGSSMAGAQSPPLGQGTSVEYLRDLVQKRIITLTYLRNIHEGRSHWFHTIQLSRLDLDREFSNNLPAIRKRTPRFAILGMSLSTLLDIHQPQDLLRGLLNVITEFDQSKEEGDNKSAKIKLSQFKKRTKKGTSGIAEYTGSYADNSADASFLLTPSMPFPLDYNQTLLSLLDVLSEIYNKIGKLLGPSPFPHSSQHMMGPLGLLSPHPGVSYLFPDGGGGAPPNQNQGLHPNLNNMTHHHHSNPNLPLPSNISGLPETTEMSGSLWGIANAHSGTSGSMMHAGGFAGPPPMAWTITLGEMVINIDKKLKKITSTLLKDLDALARNAIKAELASLDPLLRNLGGPAEDGGFSIYEGEAL
ncbi:hypothetical protein B0H34DRAFT_298434 [Crassisporium funariophilum]|nr:hypothetical protein B0H34DRAFT_298434 [Crassisporium funariophilum]